MLTTGDIQYPVTVTVRFNLSEDYGHLVDAILAAASGNRKEMAEIEDALSEVCAAEGKHQLALFDKERPKP